MTLLETGDLTKVYRARRAFGLAGGSATVAVRDLSLKLDEWEALGLVGESGSGKSTAARLIMGLERPSSGWTAFRGQRIDRLSRGELTDFRKQTQIVFQDPQASLDPRMRVGRAVAEPLDVLLKPDRAERLRRVQELLEEVGLSPGHAECYPHQLSGGERQRVGIARALAPKPRLIVLDEPVTALDVSIRAQILNLLLDLQDRYGLSYLYISHDLATVRQVCNRVAVMKDGQIVEQGDTESLFAAPKDPYTQRLLAAVPTLP